MRIITSCIVAVGLLLAGSGVALADTSTGSGPITETGHHHEFTNCGGSGLINLANCVDLADL